MFKSDASLAAGHYLVLTPKQRTLRLQETVVCDTIYNMSKTQKALTENDRVSSQASDPNRVGGMAVQCIATHHDAMVPTPAKLRY